MTHNHVPLKVTLTLILCTAAWGAIHPINKNLMESGIDAYLVSFLRFFLATIAMIPVYVRKHRRGPRPTFGEVVRLSGLGIFGVTLFALLFAFGLRRTNPSSSSILVNSQPIFMTVMGILMLGEKPGSRHILGLVLGSVGIVFVVTRGDFSAIVSGESFFVGNMLCVLASVSISYFYVRLKAYVTKYGSVIPTFISMAAGTVFIVIAAAAGGADFGILLKMDFGNWLGILHVSVIATALGHTLFHNALHEIGVSRASVFKFLTPVFGLLLSMIFLGDRGNLWFYAGMILVLGAIILIQTGGSPLGKRRR